MKLACSVLLGALLLPQAALAVEVSNDALCQAIGDSPTIAVQPRDRAFFNEGCVCFRERCAYKASPKGKRLSAIGDCLAEAYNRLSAEVTFVGDVEQDVVDDAAEAIVAECRTSVSAQKAYKRGLATQTRWQNERAAETAAYVAKLDAEKAHRAREASYMASRWSAADQFGFKSRCTTSITELPSGDTDKAFAFCECFLERVMGAYPERPPDDKGDGSVVVWGSFRTISVAEYAESLAPARAECAAFAGVQLK